MHTLKPHTKYRILAVHLVVPADFSEGEVADGLSAILSGAIADEDSVLADWSYHTLNDTWRFDQYPVVETDEDPEEGELFSTPLPPCRGALAYCSDGSLGLITGTEPETLHYGDGSTATGWTGIHMDNQRHSPGIGKPWSSTHPIVVSYIKHPEELLEGLDRETR